MSIECPICGAEYSEGTVKFCKVCMYSIGSDPFLTDLLNHPSKADLQVYNESLAEYKSLWKERNTVNQRDYSGTVEMVEVEGGSFTMGSDDGETDERPSHVVTLLSFLMSSTAVTVGSFEKFINETNYRTNADEDGGSHLWDGNKWERKNGVNWECNTKGEKRGRLEKNHAVTHVSWYDVTQYCNWLSRKEGLPKAYYGDRESLSCDFNSNGYRLPTEAEWEYAARGGNFSKRHKYSGGNHIDEVAWYDRNSGRLTHSVALKQANELGLFDMSGNVWEWCYDWKGEFSLKSQSNPRGSSSGTVKITRGGSWRVNQGFCRVTCRGYCLPNDSCSDLGFRLARTKE